MGGIADVVARSGGLDSHRHGTDAGEPVVDAGADVYWQDGPLPVGHGIAESHQLDIGLSQIGH